MKTDDYIAQGNSQDCLIVALANLKIHKGKKLPDLDTARHIAGCDRGHVIDATAAVQYFDEDLHSADNPQDVMNSGGLLHIRHPVVDEHIILVIPADESKVYAVNSFLGPVVVKAPQNRFLEFTDSRFTCHWYSGEKLSP